MFNCMYISRQTTRRSLVYPTHTYNTYTYMYIVHAYIFK